MKEKPYCINPKLLEDLEKAINDLKEINPFELINRNSPKIEIEEYRNGSGELYAISSK